jgi:hypothetical protein
MPISRTGRPMRTLEQYRYLYWPIVRALFLAHKKQRLREVMDYL